MKKLLPVLLIVFLVIMNIPSAQAVSLSPSSGTLPASATQRINIIASPPSGADAVQIRLILTGSATITSYTGPTGAAWSPGPIGVCSGSTTFTSTRVCVDLANSGTITSGESLGSFTIATGAEGGSVSIARDTDNGYLVGVSIVPQTGTVGTYSIGSSSLSLLPNTAIVDNPRYIILMGALSLILLGVTVYRVYPVPKNNH
ncbi:hypothetical protein JW978_02770 [Candidatus Dojkabacteria bacterium]|nr:hypothetical protein [Candidatus Dojkabacteria bacterium]